jgi:hypothetical protein
MLAAGDVVGIVAVLERDGMVAGIDQFAHAAPEQAEVVRGLASGLSAAART